MVYRKYVVWVIVLAIDILLFAALGRALTTGVPDWLQKLLLIGDNPQIHLWVMVGLAMLFVLLLAQLGRWLMADVRRWLKRTLQSDHEA